MAKVAISGLTRCRAKLDVLDSRSKRVRMVHYKIWVWRLSHLELWGLLFYVIYPTMAAAIYRELALHRYICLSRDSVCETTQSRWTSSIQGFTHDRTRQSLAGHAVTSQCSPLQHNPVAHWRGDDSMSLTTSYVDLKALCSLQCRSTKAVVRSRVKACVCQGQWVVTSACHMTISTIDAGTCRLDDALSSCRMRAAA